MRLVVHGAGAIGGVVGGLAARAGQDVVLVARGAHLEALRRDGLRLVTPDGDERLDVPVVSHPAELSFDAEDDVLLLCVKSQQTDAALDQLVAAGAPVDLPIACLQNGVENERRALRRFTHVLGVLVFVPGVHLVPGTVELYAQPAAAGVLDIGRVPGGVAGVAEALSQALVASGFASRTVDDILAWKRGKLLANVGNALEVVCGQGTRSGEIMEALGVEARAVFAAAGLPVTEIGDRTRAVDRREIAGRARPAGSTWQSVERDQGSVETDYLNGEVVLLGRLHGVPTPVNLTVQQAMSAVMHGEVAPGSRSPDELLGAL